MSQSAVAVVTGANKGIGFAIVRGLCKQFKGDVYLTARDESRGKAAVAELEREGLQPKFHQLDVDDITSIERMRDFLSENYGGIDLLINNAGIVYKDDSVVPLSDQAEFTLRTNYWGSLNVCRILFPIIRSHGRVVILSSLAAKMVLDGCSETLRSELRSCNTVDQVNEHMQKFVKEFSAGNHVKFGWPETRVGLSTAYGVSKIGLTLVAEILQREIDADGSRSDIIVNSCSPGYVATEMTSMKGTKTIDEGADTPLYLALLPPDCDGPRGEFVRDRVVTSIW